MLKEYLKGGNYMQRYNLSDLDNIEHWIEYRPDQAQYINFSGEHANLILAGHKIEDVHRQFQMARTSLKSIEIDDFGQLIEKNNDIALKLIRSKFLFDALALYNYCIDLSWQMVYLYHGDAHIGTIQDEKYYIKATKKCTHYSLEKRLIKVKKKESLINHIKKFNEHILTKEIREAYNYMKHRGTFHVEGLDSNKDKLPFVFNGHEPKMLNRRTINIEEWKIKLIHFDKNFYHYFESIINDLMPDEYLDRKVSWEDLMNATQKLTDFENEQK